MEVKTLLRAKWAQGAFICRKVEMWVQLDPTLAPVLPDTHPLHVETPCEPPRTHSHTHTHMFRSLHLPHACALTLLLLAPPGVYCWETPGCLALHPPSGKTLLPPPFSFLRVGPPRSNLCPLLRKLAALGAWHNKGRRAWTEPEPYPYPSAWPSSILTYLPAAAADAVPG